MYGIAGFYSKRNKIKIEFLERALQSNPWPAREAG